MVLLPVLGVWPTIPASCFVAPNATIVGDVVFGEQCSVWFQAVVRGDVNKIRIGALVNIQDGVVIHCTYQKTETHIGDRVSIGHKAILHGCTIEPDVLIGMGAIVMDRAIVETGAIVAAGAIITEGMRVQAGYIYAGIPAKPIKPVSTEQRQTIARTAQNYVKYSGWLDSPK